MYLSRFGVKHYKCLGEIDIPLTPIHVLIGENDAGKTSLLEAMAALHASSEKQLAEIFPQPCEGRELVNHVTIDSHIELYGGWSTSESDERGSSQSDFRYGLRIDFPSAGRRFNLSEEWFEFVDQRVVVPCVTPAWTTLSRWKLGNEVPEEIGRGLEEVSLTVKPAQRYALDAKTMAVPAAPDLQRKFKLDPDGFGLATLLDDIVNFKPELFIQLRDKFCEYFQQFKSVRVESENALVRQSDPTGIHRSSQSVGKGIFFETRSGQTVRAQHASDGAILFLGLLAIAHLPEPPALVLIEEPENGIYPKRLGEVIAMLKDLVNRTEGVRFPQIIMTTHSPYVLSFFEPEEVTFLSREPGKPDGPVRARPLREAPNIKERMGGEFYLGELWYNLSEEELFGEP